MELTKGIEYLLHDGDNRLYTMQNSQLIEFMEDGETRFPSSTCIANMAVPVTFVKPMNVVYFNSLMNDWYDLLEWLIKLDRPSGMYLTKSNKIILDDKYRLCKIKIGEMTFTDIYYNAGEKISEDMQIRQNMFCFIRGNNSKIIRSLRNKAVDVSRDSYFKKRIGSATRLVTVESTPTTECIKRILTRPLALVHRIYDVCVVCVC